MPRAPKVTHENAVKAAVLMGEGMNQIRIREIMGEEKFSAPTIARLVERARKEELLLDRVECLLPESKKSEVLMQLTGAKKLLELLSETDKNTKLQSLRIYSSTPNVEDRRSEPNEWLRRLRAFTRRVAPVVLKMLEGDIQNLGVAWGRTLSYLVHALESQVGERARFAKEERVALFQISGDPVDVWGDVEQSTAMLIARLNLVLNGSRESRHVFMGVPGNIPREVNMKDEKVIRKFFKANEKYRATFEKGGWIDRAQGILTSVNQIDAASVGPWTEAAAKSVGLSVKGLNTISVGNIAGIILPRPDLSAKSARLIEEINDRSTGIKPSKLSACARRAKENPDHPGVIVVSSGPKADVILEAVRLGMVSRLHIDQVLAKELLKRLDPAKKL